MTAADQYPVCPDCGQRHPAASDFSLPQLFSIALEVILSEAKKITAAAPGTHVDLEQALDAADRIGEALQAQQPTAKPTPPAPPSDDVAYGMYL